MLDLKPVIELAQKSTAPQTLTIEGRQYARRGELEMVTPPEISPLSSATLQAVVDYVESAPESKEGLFLHVQDYRNVLVYGAPDAVTKRRPVYFHAKAAERWSLICRPGNYYSQQDFLIWLLRGFHQGAGDWERLFAIASSAKKEKSIETTSNGAFQAIAVKQGIKSGFEELKNPVFLSPYRSFAEIDALLMAFCFSVKDGGENSAPDMTLEDADSGAWEVNVVTRVKTWLRERLPEIAIIG